MPWIMTSSPKFAAFLAASLLLAVIPGPGVIYLTTQTLAHGRRAGFSSLCGVALGGVGNAVAASLGLAALLAVSAAAFAMVKFAGAVYLIFLGIRMLRCSVASRQSSMTKTVSLRKLFGDGVVVSLLNPKTTLFFAAFIPQFVDPSAGSALLQSLLLAGIFLTIAAATDSIYVMAASAVSGLVRAQARWRVVGRRASAAIFIALGVYAAMSEPKQAR